jgi:hypothetical protein
MSGAVAEAEMVGVVPKKRQMSPRWHECSTDLMERYEMSLRGAQGTVVRQQTDSGGYSAYIGYEGRQQWASQLFGDVRDAKAWCEVELVQRTSNEAK